MKLVTYLVVLQRTGGSDWGASVPDLPGCVAVAKTLDGALRRVHTAIELHLAGMRADGQPRPRPKQRIIRPRKSKRGCEFYATVEVAA